jgi:uncharacterized membrane protein YGL010W
MQGTSANQFLIMVPVLIVPILIFSLFYYLFSVTVGVTVLCVLGLIGLVLKNTLMNMVTEQYRKKKYGMIAGFKEKNS